MKNDDKRMKELTAKLHEHQNISELIDLKIKDNSEKERWNREAATFKKIVIGVFMLFAFCFGFLAAILI